MRITSNIKKTVEKDAHMNCVPAYKCPQKQKCMHRAIPLLHIIILVYYSLKQQQQNNNNHNIEYSKIN